MDPVASAVSMVDVSVRVVKYLKGIHADSKTFEIDIQSLIHEVEAIGKVTNAIKSLRQDSLDKEETEFSAISELWRKISATIVDCEKILSSLDRTIKEIYGESPEATGFKDSVAKVKRMRSKEGQLSSYKESLTSYHHVLDSLLKVISLRYDRLSEENHAKLYAELREGMSALREALHSRIDEPPPYSSPSSYENLRKSVDAAFETLTAESQHVYFEIPAAVSPIFTGRQALLDELRDVFIAPNFRRQDKQRRFVIQGLGGSGKTQFASKFAQDNQHYFPGVFYVDASTSKRLNQSFELIAKRAKAEPNLNSALHWLASLECRWLLIIDNADDPDIKISNYFPRGNKGHILITTKNPSLRNIGNVVPGFYHFRGLEFDESNRLLLRAANHLTPWEELDKSTQRFVANITEALDALAIAVDFAGKAIADGLCEFVNYLEFYDRYLEKVRRKRRGKKPDEEETVLEETVFSTWEICFRRLEEKNTESTRDAIQLLKTFAFLHREDIRYDILLRAMQNSQLEAQQAKKQEEDEKALPIVKTKSFWQEVKDINIAILRFFLMDRTPPVLPQVIREGRMATSDSSVREYDDRIREALSELTHMSLITGYRKDGDKTYSYSIHPIVHRWMREREETSNSEQVLWAEAAANLLSSSILIPPLGTTPEDESFNRHLLPHIDHVRKCLDEKNKIISDSRSKGWRLLPFIANNTMNPARALRTAKFGVVYLQCGHFIDTEKLMRSVQTYTYAMLGSSHATSRRISLVLSDVLWHLGEVDEAIGIQEEVIAICNSTLAKGHPDTFRAMDKLGSTLALQGRYTEAMKYHEPAVDGLHNSLGWNSEDCLEARDHLASTISRFWEREDLEKAYNMHGTVIEEMTAKLGADSIKTLVAMENRAHVAMFLDDKRLKVALDLMDKVLDKRKAILGKEHPFTLLAMLNLALIKLTMGEAAEAENLIRTSLPTAERTLGRDHIGVSYGRSGLASTLLAQQRCEEAEGLLYSASENMKTMKARRGTWHPDRLGTLIELAKCYRLQSKFTQSIKICHEALTGFEAITPSNKRAHPLCRALKVDCARMEEYLDNLSQGGEVDEKISAPAEGGYRLYHCF